MENENDEIIISYNGINGGTFYQAENFKTKEVIIPWLKLEDFAKKFTNKYTDFSEKISIYCEGFYPGILPDGIRFPGEPVPRGNLIEKISSEFLKFQKNKTAV